jgi:hypothetical protein
MDLEEDYVAVEDQPSAYSNPPGEQKRETKMEAERLYEAWKNLISSLVLPFLAYVNRSASHPTPNTFESDNSSPCTTCAPDTHKTTRVLCLFWDRKLYI